MKKILKKLKYGPRNIICIILGIAFFVFGIIGIYKYDIEDDYNSLSALSVYNADIPTKEVGKLSAADFSKNRDFAAIVNYPSSLMIYDTLEKKITKNIYLDSLNKYFNTKGDVLAYYVIIDNNDRINLLAYELTDSALMVDMLIQFDRNGKYIGSVNLANDLNTIIYQPKLIGDKIYYLDRINNKLYSVDCNTLVLSEEGEYPSYDNMKAFKSSLDDNLNLISVSYNNQITIHSRSGEKTDIIKPEYSYINDSKDNTLVSNLISWKGEIYYSDTSKNALIRKVNNQGTEIVLDYKDIIPDFEENALSLWSNCILGLMVSKDTVVGCIGSKIFYSEDLENWNTISFDEGADAGLMVKLFIFCHNNKLILFEVLAILGFFLIILGFIKIPLTIRTKYVFIIIPFVILIAVGLNSIYSTIVVDNSKVYTEYALEDEVCLLAQLIDTEALSKISTLEDVNNDDIQRIRSVLVDFKDDSNYFSSVQLYILGPAQNGVAHQITGTTNNPIGISVPIIKSDLGNEFTNERVFYSEYRFESVDIDNALVELKYEGKVVGYLCAYDYDGSVHVLGNIITKYLRIAIFVIILILTIIIIIIGTSISRKLRKTSLVIGDIASGNLDVRVEKIPKDELGIVATGVNEMADRIKTMFEDERNFTTDVIETLVSTIEAKDKYTNGHSLRVAKYSRDIARRLGMKEEEINSVYYAGLLHDIGKIGIPDQIINKTSRLSDDEFAIIKGHPEIGYKLLENLKKMKGISVGAFYHHERFDGRGYPSGLSGNQIPFIARIIAVADAYDAMTSTRSYRKSMTQDKVRAEIEKGKGLQFDPQLADIMLEIDHLYESEVYSEA